MAHIIAFANHKGGVGKTTSVANIGAALNQKGQRVLLVDLDAQQNLTSCFLPDEKVEALEVSVYDALVGKAPLPVIPLKDGLSIVPSGIELARAEIDLSQKLAREQLLKRLLKPMAEEYDFILLDCPPSLGIITTNALTAAEALYIPLTAEALPMKGLQMLEAVVEEVKDSINPTLSLSGVFITRYNTRKSLNQIVLETIERKYGSVVFSTKIRENVAVAEAPLTQQPICDYSPKSKGAEDYENLTMEILNRWKK
jgi:chromosome partitioning protein